MADMRTANAPESDWVQIPSWSCTSCVTLGKILNLSGLQVAPLLLQRHTGVNQLRHGNHLAQLRTLKNKDDNYPRLSPADLEQ